MASLYRKYRSHSFEDLFGQPHVVRTLRNAVRSGRIAHAYLFTGPRGTGKTSTARILAKAVNCLNPQDGGPCNLCENCAAADDGRAMDVIEIDAASNTSVDNVRDLRERVGYASGQGRYKVYIVDEVHRLSGAAFDAFLKTLEEPPPHVIFVFASTEPHKVPETIMSRCQRFDFRRISSQESAERLEFVAEAEGLRVADDALRLLAQLGRGSLRDALGLLDQVSAFSAETIDAGTVRDALGLADPMLVAHLSDRLLAGETGAGLDEFHAFTSGGGEISQLMSQLVEYWRALLVRVSGARSDDLVVDAALEAGLAAHAAQLTPGRVVQVLRALTEQEFSARFNVSPELSFEVRYIDAALALQAPAAPTAEASSAHASLTQAAPERPTPTPSRVPQIPGTVPIETARAAGANGGAAGMPTNGHHQEQPPAISDGQTPAAANADGSPQSSPVANGNAPAPAAAAGSHIDQIWDRVVNQMRNHSRTLQAVLRSGHVLRLEDGEMVIGFLFDFHANQFSEAKKRKLLEQAIEEVTGVSYRVRCVKTSREEVEQIRGADAFIQDDGFVEEAAERLRNYHARQLGG